MPNKIYEHYNNIKESIQEKQFTYIVTMLKEGYKEFLKIKPLIEGINDIQTHSSSVGHVRSKKIDDYFCNNLSRAAIAGFRVDSFRAGTTRLPKLIKDKIILTIKGCKSITRIMANPSKYMKDLGEKNTVLEE